MPVDSLQGPPGLVPQCRVPNTELRPLTSSRMSTSPEVGHVVPVRSVEPSIQNAGQYPAPFVVFRSGCWMDACICTTPPAGAPKVAACVSTRPEVQPAPGTEPSCSAMRTRCPAPSWLTLAVLSVIVSISPVPKLLPGPVSYFQVPVSRPDPLAPEKSSLQVVENPAGGAGTSAGLAVPADAPVAVVTGALAPAARARAPVPTLRRRAQEAWRARWRCSCLVENTCAPFLPEPHIPTGTAPMAGVDGLVGSFTAGRSPADGDEQVLGVAVGDERGLAGDVVVGEAVGQAVDRVVVPELGVVVGRCGLVELAWVGPLRLGQLGDVPVERRAHVGVAGQRAGAPGDVGGARVHADRLGVGGEVVRVLTARTEGAVVARRGDVVRRLDGGQVLELGRHLVLEPLERRRTVHGEGGLVLTALRVVPDVGVPPPGQLQTEAVDACRVAVEHVRPDRELDEVLVLPGRRAQVEVHAAGGVGRHVEVGLFGDGVRLAVEAPVDLAVGIVAVGPVEDLQFEDVLRGRDGARVAPEVIGRRRRGRPGGAHRELPQRVAVRGGPYGAGHPHVPAGAGGDEGLLAPGAGRGAVDGRPAAGAAGRDLDLFGC